MVDQTAPLASALSAVVQGDLTGLPSVLSADQADLIEAAAQLPELRLTRRATADVLQAWCDGRWSAKEVQKWASFVRRGFVAEQSAGPIRPVDITYDTDGEDTIVEIIARLDEIGDLVDGLVDEAEREDMIRRL
ncbi:hypothetical protein MASR1M32_07170 [Rhodobacter sp.]